MKGEFEVIFWLCLLFVGITSIDTDEIINDSVTQENNISKLDDTIPDNTSDSLVTDGTCTFPTAGTDKYETIKVGEEAPARPPSCYKTVCRKPNLTEDIGCDSITVRTNCVGTFYDMVSKYPDCCPKEVC